jgi:SAM-dependent methyltransferase
MLSNRFDNDNKSTLKLNNLQIKEIEIVKNKIDLGKYEFVDVDCPICNKGSVFQLISKKDRYGFYYPMKICESCGIVMANPRLRDEDYKDFYSKGHQKNIYVGSKRPNAEYFAKQYKRGRKIYSLTINKFPANKAIKVLEVGCGAGGILNAFKEKGHVVKGIDLNSAYLEYGKSEFGLDLSVTNLFDIKDEKFDLIIYSHVLEHITEIGEHLNFIKQLLTPNGIVYIEVPGIKESYKTYGDFLRYLQNAHVINFSFTSLSNLLNKYNYSLISEPNEKIESLWELSNTDPKVFKNDFDACLHYLRSRNSFPLKHLHKVRRKLKVYFQLLRRLLKF